jgi:cAMP-dependent protein kinase regulator
MISWLSSRGESVETLIAQKKYDKAIEVIKVQLKENPRNTRLRLQMGDVLAMAQRTESAIKLMMQLAEEFAHEGFVPKAIAVLKKVQRLDPNRMGVEDKLADLIQRRTSSIPSATASVSPAATQPAAPVEEFHDMGEEAEIDVGLSMADEPAMDAEPAADGAAPVESPLFGDFSREELIAVMKGLNLLSYEPGEIIMTEGEPGSSLYVLTTGAVRAYVINSFGSNTQVRTMEEGEFFGEISLLTGNPRTATITAAMHCELLELDRKTLDEISKDHPHVSDVVKAFHDQRAGSTDEMMARSS